jgi:hypothetical protein
MRMLGLGGEVGLRSAADVEFMALMAVLLWLRFALPRFG